MADEHENETCDQTRETTRQENEQEEPKQPVRENVVSAGSNSPPTNGKGKKSGRKSFGRKVSEWLPAIGVGMAVGVAGVAAAPVVAGAALGAVGFTTSGVAAGSIAAAAQSAFYGGYVASGSLFALLQSAGAAGISAATSGAIGGCSGIAATIGTKWFQNRKSSDAIKLLICGSGDGAHAFAGIASANGADVRVLCLYQDKAECWSAAMQKKELEVTLHQKDKEPTRVVFKPALVTKNPEDVVQDVDIVVFFLEAFEGRGYLKALQRHIKAGTIIVGLPGNPGFEFQTRVLLDDSGRQCTIMNFESSPWVCRTTEFGMKCEVHDIKETLEGTMKKGDVSPKKDPVATLQYLLGPLPKLMVSDRP